MIMSGQKDATLLQVRLVDIHGTHFYDIEYMHDEAREPIRRTRVGAESVYADPRPGDLVAVSYLMNVVTSIARR